MKSYIKFMQSLNEDIPPESRTWKNIPKFSTGKLKIPFQTWLGLKGQGSKGHDGKHYGWSHRAVYGFQVGDTIKGNNMSHKHYVFDGKNDGETYTIKTDKEAKEHALRFADAVS